jgi:hypothetical protein
MKMSPFLRGLYQYFCSIPRPLTDGSNYIIPKLSDFSSFIVENHNVGVRFIEPKR